MVWIPLLRRDRGHVAGEGERHGGKSSRGEPLRRGAPERQRPAGAPREYRPPRPRPAPRVLSIPVLTYQSDLIHWIHGHTYSHRSRAGDAPLSRPLRPTRLSILQRLRFGERCVCDLTDALDAAQSRLSFHLKVLKDAGLVTDRREGRWMYYTVNAEALAELAELVQNMASAPSAAERRSGCC